LRLQNNLFPYGGLNLARVLKLDEAPEGCASGFVLGSFL
jgi:hypothetical protein